MRPKFFINPFLEMSVWILLLIATLYVMWFLIKLGLRFAF